MEKSSFTGVTNETTSGDGVQQSSSSGSRCIKIRYTTPSPVTKPWSPKIKKCPKIQETNDASTISTGSVTDKKPSTKESTSEVDAAETTIADNTTEAKTAENDTTTVIGSEAETLECPEDPSCTEPTGTQAKTTAETGTAEKGTAETEAVTVTETDSTAVATKARSKPKRKYRTTQLRSVPATIEILSKGNGRRKVVGLVAISASPPIAAVTSSWSDQPVFADCKQDDGMAGLRKSIMAEFLL